MLFLLIAGVVIWRIRSGTHPQPTMLMCFAGMIMLSGCMCFMLENKWFMRLSPTNKVPAYSLLGASVTFALLFSLVDLINYFSTTCSDTYSIRPLVCSGHSRVPHRELGTVVLCMLVYSNLQVETEKQVYLVVVTSVGMGLVFGAIFGLLDVEDESLAHIRIALMREERYCSTARPCSCWELGAVAVLMRSNSTLSCLHFLNLSICYPIGAIVGAGASYYNQASLETPF